MLIIPAIDIHLKRVVRLKQGDFQKETLYSNDAVDVAKQWQDAGARLLHMVDLDGALSGEPKNLDVIERVCREVKMPVQAGGGLRTEESVSQALSKGVSRVIVGTRAYKDDNFVKSLVKNFGKDKFAVGIDASGGIIASKGWTELTGMNAIETIRKMESLGAGTVIYTDIKKDGTLEGPRIDIIRQILEAVSINVIISGGISCMQDIKDLKALGRPNLHGIVVGKALYEAMLDLKQAIKIAEED